MVNTLKDWEGLKLSNEKRLGWIFHDMSSHELLYARRTERPSFNNDK